MPLHPIQGNLEDLDPVDRLSHDLSQGIEIVIGFNEQHQFRNAMTLRQFIMQHPKFTFLIQPILDHDPQEASTGEIFFQLNPISRIVGVRLRLLAVRNDGQVVNLHFQMPVSDVYQFINLTEPFGLFMTDGGNTAVNF